MHYFHIFKHISLKNGDFKRKNITPGIGGGPAGGQNSDKKGHAVFEWPFKNVGTRGTQIPVWGPKITPPGFLFLYTTKLIEKIFPKLY